RMVSTLMTGGAVPWRAPKSNAAHPKKKLCSMQGKTVSAPKSALGGVSLDVAETTALVKRASRASEIQSGAWAMRKARAPTPGFGVIQPLTAAPAPTRTAMGNRGATPGAGDAGGGGGDGAGGGEDDGGGGASGRFAEGTGVSSRTRAVA